MKTSIILLTSNRVKSLVVAFKPAIVILVIRRLYTYTTRMGKEGEKGNGEVIIGAHFLLPS